MFLLAICFFFNDSAPTEIYTYLHTLSLNDALPISPRKLEMSQPGRLAVPVACLPAWREDTLMTVVAMSHGELSRYDTLRRFERGELRIEDAAMLLGICQRQVYRLLDRLRADGPDALVSRKRGRPSRSEERRGGK